MDAALKLSHQLPTLQDHHTVRDFEQHLQRLPNTTTATPLEDFKQHFQGRTTTPVPTPLRDIDTHSKGQPDIYTKSTMSLASPFMSPKASVMADSTKSSVPSVVNDEHLHNASINGHDSVLDKPAVVTDVDVQGTATVASLDQPISEVAQSSVPGGAEVSSSVPKEEASNAVPVTQDRETKEQTLDGVANGTAVNEGIAASAPSVNDHVESNGTHHNGQVLGAQKATLEPIQEAAAAQPAMYASRYAPRPPQQEPASATRGPVFDSKFRQIPRAPRRGAYNGNHRPQYDLHDNVRTLEAKLLKANQELKDERAAHQAALSQARKDCEIAVETLASDVLAQKIRLVHQEEDVRQQKLDLEARKKLIRNIETILAIGQKQFADADAGVDRSPEEFVNINEQIIRERVAHEMAHRDRKAEAHLVTRARELELREADLEMRQKGYEPMLAQNLEKLEAKIRGDVEAEITARVGKAEYARGLAESNASASFDRGYAACFAMFQRMKQLQDGQLAHDSPEVAFLFDLSHPENPYARGVQVGRLGFSLPGQQLPASSQTSTLPGRHVNGTNGINGYGTGTTYSPYSSDQTPRSNTTTFPPARMNGNGNGTVENGESNHAQVAQEDESVPLIDL